MQGGGASAAIRPRAVADHARHRRLQACQRHLRPPAGRRGPARGRRASSTRSPGASTSRPGTGARSSRSPCRRPGWRGGRAGGADSSPDRGASGPAARRRRDRSSHREPGGGVDARSADSARTLIAAADAALYEAKRAGKNRVSGAPEARAAGRPERRDGAQRRMHLSASARSPCGWRRPCRNPCLCSSNWRITLLTLSAMGILDDAIREHLDLKRQHGAAERRVEAASRTRRSARRAARATPTSPEPRTR